jgi:asparagine synthase (glutamine-hydrolysing)
VSGFFAMVREDGKPVEEAFLKKIAQAMSFRGPHGANFWSHGAMGGAFALMRTGPAPQAEYQPVTLDGTFCLWGDVRLDAREDLQKLLGSDGGPANAAAETSEQLLLRAWHRWGADALDKVIGDFSFAVWDQREHTMWCARDFVGARPLYYAYANGVFCFSNTLDIVRHVPEVSAELNELFIADFLLDDFSLDPVATVYRDVRRLPAGHILKFAEQRLEVRRFRKLPIEEPLYLKSSEEYIEVYLDLLRTAIRDRLPSGPIALYLSGGLDSSSVCAITTQLAPTKDNLKAFTFSWEPFVKDLESPVAKLTADHLGIGHEILCEPDARLFEGAITEESRTPEPFSNLLFKAEQKMHRRITAHSNVVLSGDGGDNVLVGQSWPYLRELWKRGDWSRIVSVFGGYLGTHGRLPPLRGGFRSKFGRLLKRQNPPADFPEWLDHGFCSRLNLKQRWVELKNRRAEFEHPFHPIAYDGLQSGYWAEVLETEDAGWLKVNLETRRCWT